MIPRDQDLHPLNTEPGKESLAFQKLQLLRRNNDIGYVAAKALAHKVDAEIMKIDDPNHETGN
jgi:hypothetical protein